MDHITKNQYLIPTDEFPTLLAAIRSLGETHEERRQRLGVGSTKYVERLLRRLPESLAPFAHGPAALTLAQALVADLQRRADTNDSVIS